MGLIDDEGRLAVGKLEDEKVAKHAPSATQQDVEPAARSKSGATTNCVFCKIVGGEEPASRVYEDATVLAFMNIRPTGPGECLVIPKEHVDHFTDVDDTTAQHIMLVALRIGRQVRRVFKPQRVGMVVHGFGVSHAHLIVVPQDGPHHLTSAHFARIKGGRVTFSMEGIPSPDRSVLDEHARLLRDVGE